MRFNELSEVRNKIFKDYVKFREPYSKYIELIDSLSPDYNPGESNPVEFLGKSIYLMKDADIVLMPMDYFKSKGCKCELYVAQQYNKTVKTYFHCDESTYFFDDFIEVINIGG